MEDKIQGFVLQSIRYGDSSLIVRIYTRDGGLQSYMVKGVRGKTSRNRIAFFQPMTFLRFVQSGKPSRSGLAFMKDSEVLYAYQSIPNEMNKSAILMYLSELLFQSVVWLDLVETGYANFPLYFTLELSRFLGFYPQSNYHEHAFFDMMEGQFVMATPPHQYYLQQEESRTLSCLLNRGIDDLSSLVMNGLQRNNLLDGIITFMRLHAPVFKGLQSHEVLKEVLR